MKKRISVSIDPEEERTIATFGDPTTAERTALTSWAVQHGVDASRLRSQAAVIRALVRVGAQSLRDEALDDGYAALAASLKTSEQTTTEQAETREARERYLRRGEAHAPE